MSNANDKVTVIVEKDGEKTTVESPIPAPPFKLVVIINNQFTDAPNTTQIASGAGLNSAAGSNAAIDSSNTLQQQSVGAAGEADNSGMNGEQEEPHQKACEGAVDRDVVIVINNQINKAKAESAATQVASGGGIDSASGTNSVIGSSNSKQQHAVGGSEGASASNTGMDDSQREACEHGSHAESTGSDEVVEGKQHHKRQARLSCRCRHHRKRQSKSSR